MTGGFGVDPAALTAHAADVDAVAARVRRAAEAATPLDHWAYGLLGQVFAGAATVAATASPALRATGQQIEDVADALHAGKYVEAGKQATGSLADQREWT